MTYIISHFWLWLLPIFIAGIATAMLTRQAEAKGKVAPWLIWCGLAFAAGALTALLDVMLGRAGVWLETALASFMVYMLGAGAGALLRKGDLAEHKGWALGLIPAALLWFAGNVFGTPNIEADLKQSVGAAIKDDRENARNFRVVGRDVLLPNDVADRAALAATIGKVRRSPTGDRNRQNLRGDAGRRDRRAGGGRGREPPRKKPSKPAWPTLGRRRMTWRPRPPTPARKRRPRRRKPSTPAPRP